MDDKVFEINDVSRSFGAIKAVENLTLSLGKGEVTGFLGTNGAGKTTTIKMLIGLIRPTSGATRYFDEAALLLVWGYSLFVALGIGGRLFTSEFANRTIYPLLAKPVSRGELILGKYLGAVVAGWSSLLFFYALWVVSAALRGGDWCSACFFQAFVLHALFMALATAAALCGSFLLTHSAGTTLLAVILPAMFFFGRRLPDYAQNVSGFMRGVVKMSYWILPHVEFFDMRQRLVHGWGGR